MEKQIFTFNWTRVEQLLRERKPREIIKEKEFIKFIKWRPNGKIKQ